MPVDRISLLRRSAVALLAVASLGAASQDLDPPTEWERLIAEYIAIRQRVPPTEEQQRERDELDRSMAASTVEYLARRHAERLEEVAAEHEEAAKCERIRAEGWVGPGWQAGDSARDLGSCLVFRMPRPDEDDKTQEGVLFSQSN